MTLTLHGIPNCDTVKKARVWLDQHGVAFAFHDYKKAGIDRPRLEAWVAEHGWETVLNRAGTTFRALADADKANLNSNKAVDDQTPRTGPRRPDPGRVQAGPVRRRIRLTVSRRGAASR